MNTKFGIPLSEEGADISFEEKTYLAPGVLGYAIEGEGGIIYIPDIRAEKIGNGDVAKFLDSIDKEAHIRIPSVISMKLQKMLERRGWEHGAIYQEGELITDYMERLPIEGKPNEVEEGNKNL